MKKIYDLGETIVTALSCEGYVMFEGEVKVTPKSKDCLPFGVSGVWLYRPDTGCWYCNGMSFCKEILNIKEV